MVCSVPAPGRQRNSPKRGPAGRRPALRRLLGRGLGLAIAVVLLVSGIGLPPPATGPDILMAPGFAHPLGTNDIGQDVLAGLLAATPNSITIAFLAAAATLALAILGGLAAACGGRIVQALVLRLVDILQILPSILILLVVAASLEPGLVTLVLLLALTNWHDDVRVVRALILRELTRESLQQARLVGYGWSYLSIRHLLPPIAPELRALALESVRRAALKTAGLGFLGLVDPQLPTWGGMMQDALGHLTTPAWAWLMLPPAVTLALFLLTIQRLSGDPSGRTAAEAEA